MSENLAPDNVENISDFLQRQNEAPPVPGLIIAVEFLLPCGHTISQAIRNEVIVPREHVYAAMDEARDKLTYWLTRHGIPQHRCDQVTEENLNGAAYAGARN